MHRILLPLLLVLSCHSNGSGKNGDETGSDSDPNDTEPTCLGTSFETSSSSWSLPNVDPQGWSAPFAVPSGGGYSYRGCDNGDDSYFYWTTTDLTGDSVPDLVVTYQSCDEAQLGGSRWDLYRGTGSGFEGQASSWSLPAVSPEGWNTPFALTSGSSYTYRGCDNGDDSYFYYTTMDLTGDSLPDLVVSYQSCDEPKLGVTRWDVYENTGTGFAASATSWSLPGVDPEGWSTPFALPAGSSYAYQGCDNGDDSYFYYTTMDLTGDSLPDLVVSYQSCDEPQLGESRWDVYENRGNGFAGSPTTWSLPAVHPQGWDSPFAMTGGSSYSYRGCNNDDDSYFYFTTTDMTGDSRPDLVVTYQSCDEPQLGGERWDVYENTGSGFAGNARSWPLPPVHPVGWGDTPFSMTGGSGYAYQGCSNNDDSYFYFTMADMTGDTLPDMVITYQSCDEPQLGGSRWDVYPNNGAGFSDRARTWALPDVNPAGWGESPFSQLSGGGYSYQGCSNNDDSYFYWSTMEMTGDRVPDLLVTYQSCDEPQLGDSRWDLYAGICE